MPKFRYDALDRDGNPVSGDMNAATADEVIAWLESQGLRLEWVRTADDEPESPRPQREPLTRAEAEQLGGRLGELMNSGLPLAPGLRALAAEMWPGRRRSALLEIARELESGADLPAVLESHGAPADLQALIRAGLRTGQSGELLGQYFVHVRSGHELKWRIWLGLSYPLVLFVFLAAILLFILVLLVPQFKKIYEDFGTELPGITVLLVMTSDFVRTYGIWLLLVGVPVLIGAWFAFKAILGEVAFSRITARIPIIGPMLRWSSLSRFAHLLSVLIENRVPLPEALVLAGDSTGDPEIAHTSRQLAHSVKSGEPLASGRRLAGFPASFIQALAWERSREAFPEALDALGDMFEGRARLQSALVAAVSEPLFIICAGVVLGMVVISLFMPLIKLLNDLS